MREILLILIIYPLAAVALVKPVWGLYGYIWFSLMRPDVLAWAYGENSFSLVLAIGTLLGSLRYFPYVLPAFQNRIVLMLMLLLILITISVPVAVNTQLSIKPYLEFVKPMLVLLTIPVLIRTQQDLRNLLLVVGVSLGLVGMKYGLYGVLHGGVRFVQGLGGMMSENNSLALGLVMGLPSIWFLRQQIQSKIVKFGFLVMGTLTCGAIIMCHSRAGILTLGLVIALLVMNSRSKFLVAILAAVMLIPGILLVQDTLTSRMSTLRDPTADLSAFSRILYAQAALRMWQDYPLFGVGWGMLNQQALMPRYSVLPLKQVVHNSYLQMLADAGIFAFLAYISLLFGVIYRLYKEGKRLLPLNPALAGYAGAIRIGLIAFSVNSLTQSRIHFDLFYIFVLAAAALESISAGAAGPQPVPVPSTLVSPRIEDPLPRRKMGVPQPVGSSRARTVLAKDRLPR